MEMEIGKSLVVLRFVVALTGSALYMYSISMPCMPCALLARRMPRPQEEINNSYQPADAKQRAREQRVAMA